ncbi:unnamed protein product [Paramecium primaurelia]|uniref:Uncharacterized protein n=1 Tax=Paramecium primaurelia TaxID=5886 RepID=A0A8S1NA54_PARPR|nr:unnamed protein product [Paramecium primaurelia]
MNYCNIKTTRRNSFSLNYQSLQQIKHQRRQSCCCKECGIQSMFQKLHSDISCPIQEHLRIQRDSTHSSANSNSDVSLELIQTVKKFPFLRGQLKLISLPPNYDQQIVQIKKKKRRHSCHCNECGNLSKFQTKTQNLYVERYQQMKKQFRIKQIRRHNKNKTQTLIETDNPVILHINSPMMKYQKYSRTAKLILEQNQIKNFPRICTEKNICSPKTKLFLPSLHIPKTFRTQLF